MATVTGSLLSIAALDGTGGTLEIALCGYGAQVPRTDTGFAVPITIQVQAEDDGSFSQDLPGNDMIDPPGTYYTLTVKDTNGDIVQVNAYSIPDAYDGNIVLIDPFDPSDAPPPGVPPLLANLLDVMAFNPTPIFDGESWNGWEITLTGDVTSSTLDNIQPGNLYTFIIVQDATGGHAFTWPAEVVNATPVNRDPKGMTIQTFVADQYGTLYPVAPATWWTP